MLKSGKTKNTLGPTGELIKYSMIGALVSIICVIIFSLLAAFVISKASLPHRSITPISMAVIAVSTLIGSFVAGKLFHKKGLVLGVLTGVMSFFVMLIASFFTPGESEAINVVLKAVLSVIPSVIGAVIGVNMRRKY